MQTCDQCFKRPGAVVIDKMWFPNSPSAFRFTFRLCQWCRAVKTRSGHRYPKFIGPLAAGESR